MAKIVGIVLIVLGIAGLAYKSFTVPGEKKGVQIGSLDLSVQKKERVEVASALITQKAWLPPKKP